MASEPPESTNVASERLRDDECNLDLVSEPLKDNESIEDLASEPLRFDERIEDLTSEPLRDDECIEDLASEPFQSSHFGLPSPPTSRWRQEPSWLHFPQVLIDFGSALACFGEDFLHRRIL